MGSQRVGHDWATELNWTEWSKFISLQVDIQLSYPRLLKRLFSPDNIVLAHFIRNQETIEWTLSFILLISLASLMPVPRLFWLLYLSDKFWSQGVWVSHLCFYFQNYYHFQDYFLIQGFWDLLNFSMHFRIILPHFSKVALKILIMITS